MAEAKRLLTIEARSSGLEETTAKLRSVAAAQDQVAASGEHFVVVEQKKERATQSMQARVASISRQYDAMYRAEQALARVERDLAAAQGQGLITSQRRLELLSLAADKHGVVTASINREISATERLAIVQRMQSAANQNVRTPAGSSFLPTANIAAQFQDIGVTAAMGMSPLQIALQQGTQLQAVLGPMGAAGAVRALGTAFASLVNPVSLVTLGLVGLTAYAIQYFMSAEAGADKADAALKEHEAAIGAVAKRWGDALPALKAYSEELDRQREIADRAAGVATGINIRWEQARQILPDVKTAIGGVVEELIRAGAGRGAIDSLRDGFNEVDRASQDLQNALLAGANGLAEYGALSKELAELQANESVQSTAGLTGAVGQLASAYSRAADEAKRLADEQAFLAGMERSQLGPLNQLNVFRSTPFQTEEDLMYQRGERARLAEEGRLGGVGIPTPTPRPNDIERLDWAASASRSGRSATADFDRSIEQIRARTAAMETEAAVVGMSTFASAKYLETQRLEAEARKDAIGLTPTRIAQIDAETSAYARRIAATEAAVAAEKKMHEEIAFRRDLMGGALNDVRGALSDGKLEWQELGNVAINALNKILDKLQNELLDAIFDLNKAAGTGGGGGLLGSIIGLLGGGGGFSGFEMAWTAAVPGLWAKGGAFDGGNVIPFAKGGAFADSNVMPFAAGGAFTNSIVDRPTLFPMANGAGLMGEAGPEAIMPLKRGSDGRLGVAGGGGGQQTISVAPVINIDARNAQPGVGTEIEAAVRRATADMTPQVVKALREIKRKGVAV